MSYRLAIQGMVCMQVVSSLVFAQRRPREQWGAPQVSVSHKEGIWIIEGRKNKVALNASNLAMSGFARMTNHEFLDKNRRRERSTFADGTTVTIDRDARTFEIKPALELSK